METTSFSFVGKATKSGGLSNFRSRPRTKSPRFFPRVCSARVQVSDLQMPANVVGGATRGSRSSISSIVGALAKSWIGKPNLSRIMFPRSPTSASVIPVLANPQPQNFLVRSSSFCSDITTFPLLSCVVALGGGALFHQ